MVQTTVRRKVVRSLSKGQITIPREFRDALGIDSETLLSVSLVDDHLEITPLRQSNEAIRRYSEDDISRFLEEDKLDPETAERVKELLRQGNL